MKNKMLFLPAVYFITLLTVTINVQAEARDDSWKIAMSSNIQGKARHGQCMTFAKDLYNRLIQAGGEAHLVIYDWRKNGRADRHAFVVYRDRKGRYFGMDNLTRKPVWLSGTSSKRWIQSFANKIVSAGSIREWTQTSYVSSRTVASNLGQYASLEHAPARTVRAGGLVAQR